MRHQRARWLVLRNQAFFMGLFLLIGAYFVPGSYDRKGAGHFLKDRLIRLGIPLAVYSGSSIPTWSVISYYAGQTGPLALLPGVRAVIGYGPLWFVEVLLIFSLVYVLWRLLVRLIGQADGGDSVPWQRRHRPLRRAPGVGGFRVRLWM